MFNGFYCFKLSLIEYFRFNTTLQGIVLKLSCCKKKEETPEKIKLGENGTSEVNQTLMPKGKVDCNPMCKWRHVTWRIIYDVSFRYSNLL